MNLRKIFKYFFSDIIRSKWIPVYTVLLFALTSGIIYFSRDGQKAFISLLNIALYLVPLLCLIFGSVYNYNSREFVEMLLTQPVTRKSVFMGQYLSLGLSQTAGFVLGMILPLFIYDFSINAVLLLAAGIFLIFI